MKSKDQGERPLSSSAQSGVGLKSFIVAFAISLFSGHFAQAGGGRSFFFDSADELLAKAPRSCEASALRQKISNQQFRCGSTVAEWKAFASSLLELQPRANPNREWREVDFDRIVDRNTIITEAYAHLYLMSRSSFPACGRSLLPWVGGAALGSSKSGQVMRAALSTKVGGIPEFDKYSDARYLDIFRKQMTYVPGLVALGESTLVLGKGNREIFKDLFWQLLAGVTCGPDEVIKTIENDEVGVRDPKLALSLKAWKSLAEASRTCDEKTILEGNLRFVEVEQFLVGQPVMYEGPLKKLGGFLLVPTVESAVPLSIGYFPGFREYGRKLAPRLKLNFANVHQRVKWMQDQLEVMESAFTEKASLLEPLFCTVVADAENARATLKRVADR